MSSAARVRKHRERQALGLLCLKGGLPYSNEFLEFLIAEKRLSMKDSNDDTAIRRAIHQLHQDIARGNVTPLQTRRDQIR